MRLRILILSILLFSGCRTIEKSFSSAYSKKVTESDSTSLKTEQNKARYNRETITEYIVDTLWRTRTIPDVQVVEVPKPYPYIIKQTIRESGESTQDKTEQVNQTKAEETETKDVEKEKTASVPAILQYSALVAAVALLLMGVAHFIKQIKG